MRDSDERITAIFTPFLRGPLRFTYALVIIMKSTLHQVSMMWLAMESSIALLPMLYVLRSTSTLGSFSSLSCLFEPPLLLQCLFIRTPLAVYIHQPSSGSVYSLNFLCSVSIHRTSSGSVYSPNLIRQCLFTYTKSPLVVSIHIIIYA